MTEVARIRTLRYGQHGNATTFSGETANATNVLRLTDDGASLLPRARNKIDRKLRSLAGIAYPHVRGVQDLAEITLATEFRGVNNNSGGAVSDWEAKMEQGYLLSSIFGADAPATTGAAPTVNSTGHTPASGILSVVGTTTANGQVIAFDTSAGLVVGRIASGGGTTTLTLDQPYTGTPTTGATVYRLAVYTVDPDLTHHVHVVMDAETEGNRMLFEGCAPMSMALSIPNAGLVGMSTVLSPTTWSAASAPANPAHAEPTSGSPIVNNRTILVVDGTEVLARDISLTMTNNIKMRVADTRTNGMLGGVCGVDDAKMFMLEFSRYLDDGSSLTGELTRANLNTALGHSDSAGDVSATSEVSLQVGTEIGAVMFVHMPTADVRVTTQIVDGLTVARYQVIGTGTVPGVLAVG